VSAVKIIIKYTVLSSLILFHITAFSFPWHLDVFSNEQGLTQNSITCSVSDKRGFHWFATQGGLNRFDGYDFKHYKSNSSETSISGNWITDCLNGEDENIWFSTASNGLNLLNTETGLFRVFNQHSEFAIASDRIWSIAVDTQKNLWIGHDKGQLTRLNITSNQVQSFTFSSLDKSNVIFQDIVFDDQDNLWLASSDGLFKFNSKNNTFRAIPNSKKQLLRLKKTPDGQLLIASKSGLAIFNPKTEHFQTLDQFNNIWITDILFDDESNVWISTYGQGIFYQSRTILLSQKFQNFSHSIEQRDGLVNDHLLSLYQDPQGVIWIGTDGYGLHRYDKTQNQFGHQKHQNDTPATIGHDFVRAILKDSQNQLWVGTRDGLNKKIENAFTHYKVDEANQKSLTNNNIFSLYEDGQKRIWIGTYGGGLLRYNPSSDDFSAYTVKSHQLSSDRVYAITGDPRGNLWLGSNNGLTRFNPDTLSVKHYKHNQDVNSISNNTVFSISYDRFDNVIWAGTRAGLNKLSLRDETFSHYQSDQTKPNNLSNNMVTSLYLQDENTLWVGTFGGLNKLNKKTQHIEKITESNGLLNDNIFAIAQEKSGNLWLSSNQGLTRYSPSTQQMQHFLPENGIQHNSFILGAAFQAADGELFFGGINGFNQFYPSQLELSNSPPDPVITDLLIYNQPTTTQKYLDKANQITKLISYTKKLSFEKADGAIGFKFSALNSASLPAQYQYAYKLSGLDEQFIYANEKQRQVSYSQLPAGSYKLKIKVKDQYGQWSNSKIMVGFTVIPPWWQSYIAYTVYFSIILLVMWLIIAARYRAKVAEQSSKNERELSQLKKQLLDNISHELKTPLSLILAPLESLQKRHKDTETSHQLSMIKRNSHKLLDQINQLLQLSERPSTIVKYVTPYSLPSLIEPLIADFVTLFDQKNILFKFENLAQQSHIALEPNHALSIISNLLSNAHQYTADGGQVTLKLSAKNHNLLVTISDTGIGIDPLYHDSVFQRFTRINAYNQSGSGIGLALVKQLAEQYAGTVTLESEINKGSRFTVTLPLSQTEVPDTSKVLIKPDISHSPAVKNKKILIVEDNDEMRDLIISLFIHHYICISAINGEQGLSLCKKEMPDLVISDVMMPVMDGYQLLKTLRADLATSHIPILLLSAKADSQSKLKGLDLLADDYLSKPFEPQLLIGRVQGLLSIRETLNQHLKRQLPVLSEAIKLDAHLAQSKDYVFTERVKTVVQEHYQNEAFSIEEFAAAVYLSPRALQLKMKALYNLTPSDYIRNTRLEFAQQLLKKNDLTIGLIAERVGFSSQSYFARCFKAKYALSPKHFRAQST
jgi:ligand-binding sensor domain-containing protein/signal transduction histidine kinase/DNA-binding response OmpR family regulator